VNQERRAAAETCSASAAGMTRERPHRTSLARAGEREGRSEPWSPLLVVGLAMSRSIAALSARPSFPTARTSFRPVVAAGSCGEQQARRECRLGDEDEDVLCQPPVA